MKITMDKKYRTRDGRFVRLLCVDRKGVRDPVLGLVSEKPPYDREYLETWSDSGEHTPGMKSVSDLVEVKPTFVIHLVWWCNINAPDPRDVQLLTSQSTSAKAAHEFVQHLCSNGYKAWYECIEKEVE